jgi:hypothetical protein
MRSIYERAKKPDADSNVSLLTLPEERDFARLYERIQVMSADALPIKLSLLSAQLVLMFRALTRLYHQVQKASRP